MRRPASGPTTVRDYDLLADADMRLRGSLGESRQLYQQVV
jgi:hypothetical protein